MVSERMVYPRAASGLRREWSPWVLFYYNFMANSAFSAATWLQYFLVALFPGGNAALAALIGGLLLVPTMLCYAFLASSTPRAGGDYVYVSRIIHPLFGFALTFVAGVFFLMGWANANARAWAGIYVPLAFWLAGLKGFAAWLSTNIGVAVVMVVIVVLPAVIVATGMRLMGRLVTVFTAILAVGHILLLIALASITQPQFMRLFDQFFGAGAYQGIIQAAKEAGYTHVTEFSWTQTIALMGIPYSIMLWCQSAIPHIGEVKEVEKVRRTTLAFVGPLLITTAIVTSIFALVPRAIGDEFWKSISWLFITGKLMVPPHLPWYPALAALGLGGSMMLIACWIFILSHSCQIIFYNVLNLANATKYMFAHAFDRLLPSAVTYVHPRTRAPLVALTALTVGTLIWGALAIINPEFTIARAFVANTYSYLTIILGTSVAGIFFPYTMKGVFQRSPIAKYMVGRIPLITILGILGTIPTLFAIGLYATFPALGGVSLIGVTIVALLYLIVAVYFAIVWFVRRRQGIDIGLAFKEIPPE
ncbi:MAG: amino acid permease [Candidatus Bathyarchaeia archaeon]